MQTRVRSAKRPYRSRVKSNSAQNMVLPRSKKKIQQLVDQCQKIKQLHQEYVVSGLTPELIGREFFVAVGNILSGVPLSSLELQHLTLC